MCRAKYCTSCHGDTKPKADLALDGYKDGAAAEKDRETWERVLEMLSQGEMPPRGKPRPSEDQTNLLLNWIDAALAKTDCTGEKHPGRVTIRRLNRAEYNNTIRDLVGVNFSPADDFPADDSGYGFDNIGDALSVSPLLLEKYLSAAEKILDSVAPETHRRIFTCTPREGTTNECSRTIIADFTRRAYRRPVGQKLPAQPRHLTVVSLNHTGYSGKPFRTQP